MIVALICLCCGAITGCSLKKAYPDKQRYLLEITRSAKPTDSPHPGALRIRTLKLSAPYEGRGFVYRLDEFRHESDFYHEFFVSPQAIFTEAVQHWMEQAGLFEQVLSAGSRLDADYSLEGEVTAFYADFRQRKTPKARVSIQFNLVESKKKQTRTCFQKAYSAAVPLPNAQPAVLVQGWTEGLRQILSSLEKDLSAASFSNLENGR